MADRSPTITLHQYVDAAIPGSGKYSISELLEYSRLRAQRAYDERSAIESIDTIARLSQASSTGDTPEEIAALDAGFAVQLKRLVRDYRALLATAEPTPEMVRNASLSAVIASFAARDANSDGKINKAESGLEDKLFNLLDTDADNRLTVAELQAGIAP